MSLTLPGPVYRLELRVAGKPVPYTEVDAAGNALTRDAGMRQIKSVAEMAPYLFAPHSGRRLVLRRVRRSFAQWLRACAVRRAA